MAGQKDVGEGWREEIKGQEILVSNVVGVLITRGKLRGVVYEMGACGRGSVFEGSEGRGSW